MSVTPTEMTKSIQEHLPDFRISHVPDFRQDIADSWPNSIDDSEAQNDWHWNADFDLAATTAEMLKQLKAQQSR